jgi:tRNA modification GTPase
VLHLKLIDTAGIRNTEDFVEKIGVNRSIKALQDAELVLLVLDQSKALSEEDMRLLELTKTKNGLLLVTNRT